MERVRKEGLSLGSPRAILRFIFRWGSPHLSPPLPFHGCPSVYVGRTWAKRAFVLRDPMNVSGGKTEREDHIRHRKRERIRRYVVALQSHGVWGQVCVCVCVCVYRSTDGTWAFCPRHSVDCRSGRSSWTGPPDGNIFPRRATITTTTTHYTTTYNTHTANMTTWQTQLNPWPQFSQTVVITGFKAYSG